MISYLMIYGPPLLEAIKALRKMSLGFPEVCIMDQVVGSHPEPMQLFTMDPEIATTFFSSTKGTVEVDYKKCQEKISKSGQKIGDYDFYFEWFEEPSMEDLEKLISKVDETLKPLGCSYKMITK
jgi:hypothetical protein